MDLDRLFILREAKSAPAEGDKEAALLIPPVYLLKTDHRKEKQCCHSHAKCSYSVLFRVIGRSNVKDQISVLKILTCNAFFFCKFFLATVALVLALGGFSWEECWVSIN